MIGIIALLSARTLCLAGVGVGRRYGPSGLERPERGARLECRYGPSSSERPVWKVGGRIVGGR